VQQIRQKAKHAGPNLALGQLTPEKKKAAIAVLLISIMALMWVRVLLKKNQSLANAAIPASQAAITEEIKPKIKVTYIDLPCIKGRNDMLSRDVFSGSVWEGLGAEANGAKQFKVSHKKNDNERLNDTIETIGKELKLDAIFSGKNPQASVGGMLVSPQGKLTVKYEGDQYEFKVVAISDNEVVLECKGVQVKLSMTRPTDSAN
jgi:hypothetical protein